MASAGILDKLLLSVLAAVTTSGVVGYSALSDPPRHRCEWCRPTDTFQPLQNNSKKLPSESDTPAIFTSARNHG